MRKSHSASDYFLPVVAILYDRTAFAKGIARAAERASVAYEIDVKGIELSRRHNLVHDLVRSPVRRFLRNQSDAPENAKDMRVEWKDLFAASEEQRTSNCLRAEAAKL